MRKNNDIDAFIGEKIRSRRHLLGMNQTDLGKTIGVTFQQIQKYEKGHNKIGASKLFDLANNLNVQVSYFFDGFNPNKSSDHNATSSFIVREETETFTYEMSNEASTREAITLVKLYNSIQDKDTRKKLLLFLKTLVKE